MMDTKVLEPAALIDDKEAARLSGISRASWHRLRSAGKTPEGIRLGRAVRFRREEVLAWIESGCPDRRTWLAMRASGRRFKVA